MNDLALIDDDGDGVLDDEIEKYESRGFWHSGRGAGGKIFEFPIFGSGGSGSGDELPSVSRLLGETSEVRYTISVSRGRCGEPHFTADDGTWVPLLDSPQAAHTGSGVRKGSGWLKIYDSLALVSISGHWLGLFYWTWTMAGIGRAAPNAGLFLFYTKRGGSVHHDTSQGQAC